MKVWGIQKYFKAWIVLSMCILLMTGCRLSPITNPAVEGNLDTYRIEVDLLGTRHEVTADVQGKLKEKVELSSADGRVCLSLMEGTVVKDEGGKPLELIQVAIDSSRLPPPEDAYIIGDVYYLKPEGAAFYPLLKLTISYDPEELPEGVRESDLYIAPYSDASGWGTWSGTRRSRCRYRG